MAILTQLQIYPLNDVRFGDQPKCFGAPSKPKSLSDELQNITKSTSCIQINPDQMSNPPGGKHLPGDSEGADLSESEDCLFLDIYALVSASSPDAQQLPVVVWIYGGGYAFDSKNQADPLYTGQSPRNIHQYIREGFQPVFTRINSRPLKSCGYYIKCFIHRYSIQSSQLGNDILYRLESRPPC
ncbi:hypothetical protein BKA56DRAFT_615232 [Ilyonectria sp. MPI-CAGE-AT-0026]|nr:hypothetical protein BKA56DRAFT_615232 [Ilyonectria sp. MPI-CAGE-AT-0026]